MAWVKIDDHFPDHPKVVSAGPLAAWLYVAGLCYCNRLLTDGFIPFSQVDRLSPHRADQDPRDSPFKLAELLCGLELWTEGNRKGVNGYFVHDYRKYQPSRKNVLRERQQNKGRQTRFRNGARNGVTSPLAPRDKAVNNAGPVPVPDPVPLREKEQIPRVSFHAPMNGTTDEALAMRAGAFCERYAELYPIHRRGARYLPKPALDYTKACELCAVWDNERLERLAVVFLKCEEPFAQSGSRTIGQFAAMASWADDRLREVEHQAS